MDSEAKPFLARSPGAAQMSSLSAAWSELGLKPHYRAEELIVLRVPRAYTLPLDAKLRLEGPAPRGEFVVLSPRREGAQNPFFEFYALRPGDYRLSASWFEGGARVEIAPSEKIGFGLEFGIFFAVVVVILVWMSRRYLMRKKCAI